MDLTKKIRQSEEIRGGGVAKRRPRLLPGEGKESGIRTR